jgi:hypothetical protein
VDVVVEVGAGYDEFMSHGWSTEPLNLCSHETITLVRQAVKAGVLCGLRAFYGAGCSPEPCAFIDFDSYVRAVDHSRPGDWFTLWSLPMLAEHDSLPIWKQKAAITEIELGRVKAWLNENPTREFIAVGIPADSDPPVAIWGDHDAIEDLLRLAHNCAGTGEFAVLPLTDLLTSGGHRKWTPRLHLVDGKRPNDRGEVPLGGAY